MKKIISIVLVLFCSYISLGQSVYSWNSTNQKYKNLSQETIFVHYNTSLLFAGEYLYYKVYCINTNTSNLSNISRIAYVELISSEGENVFKHKIELIESEGYSDFFIPTSVPSGNYKLLAYTQWMKNLGGVENFFQADISIVNPYRGDQAVITFNGSDKNGASQEGFPKKITSRTDESERNTTALKLYMEKRKFGRREQVSLTLKNLKSTLGFGKYSVSIKRLDPIPVDLVERSTAHNFSKSAKEYPRGIVYAPESSGSLILGRVVQKDTKLPAKDLNVAISISGENFFFRVATSNTQGNFRFSLDPDYDSDNAIIQVVGDTKENYEIELYDDDSTDYNNLSFESFKITPAMKQFIVERSVYNQIENAYYSIKPDTIKPAAPKKPFTYYEQITTYKLDDFARFPTMKEVFTEVVKHVWTGSDSNGNKVVKVRNFEYNKDSEFLPLVFVDGVFVQEHENLLEYNALKVDEVSVLRNQYKFGTQDYQGVILIKTIADDYSNKLSGEYLKDISLFKPERRKSYFKQAYLKNNEQLTNRTPDFRSQLLWEPSIELVSNEMSFQFFTSDNIGDYQISLEGFTIEGKPVSIREIITVVE